MRADCGGCHAHSQAPLPFEQTAAGKPGFAVVDLVRATPLLTQAPNGQPGLRTLNAGVANVEFYRDIRPILQRSCAGCHTAANPTPPGNLVLDDSFKDGLRRDTKMFFASKEAYTSLGIPWKRGILLLGPTGNGKTESIKALLKETKDVTLLYAKTMSVYLVSLA